MTCLRMCVTMEWMSDILECTERLRRTELRRTEMWRTEIWRTEKRRTVVSRT